MTQVTVSADMENNAEVWWENFREEFPKLQETDPELWHLCKVLEAEATLVLGDPQLIRRFFNFAESIPGYFDGPAHAPTALHVLGE